MARQLVENGVTFVKVRHTDYDSHSEVMDTRSLHSLRASVPKFGHRATI